MLSFTAARNVAPVSSAGAGKPRLRNFSHSHFDDMDALRIDNVDERLRIPAGAKDIDDDVQPGGSIGLVSKATPYATA